MPHDIFISYAEEDGDWAKKLAGTVEAAGYPAWYYQRDYLSGSNYLAEVPKAILAARVVVVLVSEASLGSHQVDGEVVRAHEDGKRFMPLLIGMSHAEFQSRKETWRFAFRDYTSSRLDSVDWSVIAPKIVDGLRAQLAAADAAAAAPSAAPPSRIRPDSTCWIKGSGQLERTIDIATDLDDPRIAALAYSNDGARIMTFVEGIRDGKRNAYDYDYVGELGIWDINRGGPLWDESADLAKEKFAQDVRAFAFSPDGTRIVHKASVFDALTGASIGRLGGDADGIVAHSFSADGARLGSIREWSDEQGRPHYAVQIRETAGFEVKQNWECPDQPRTIALSPDGAWLATRRRPGLLDIWNVAAGKSRKPIEVDGGLAVWSPDRSGHIATDGPRVMVWSADTGQPVFTAGSSGFTFAGRMPSTIKAADSFFGNEHPFVSALAFAPDGALIAAADGNIIRLLNAKNGAARTSFAGHPQKSLQRYLTVSLGLRIGPNMHDRVRCLAFAPDGTRLASGGQAQAAGGFVQIKLWKP